MRASRYRFGKYDRVVLEGVECRWEAEDARYHYFRIDDGSGDIVPFSHERIAAIVNSPNFQHQRNYFSEEKQSVRLKSGAERVSDLPPDEQAKVFWRKAYCDAFLELYSKKEVKRTEDSVKAVIRRLTDIVSKLDLAKALGIRKGRAGTAIVIRTPPCGKALLTWVRTYETHMGAPLALRDRYDKSGNHTARFEPDAAALLQKIVVQYASPQRPTKVMIARRVDGAFDIRNKERSEKGLPPLTVPSDKAVYRAINALDKFYVACARFGLEIAKRKFAIVGDGLDVTRPLERVEIDEWEIDLQTLAVALGVWDSMDPEMRKQIKRVRRWLSVAIDAYSRCILAMHLSATPSVDSALVTLHMAQRDKGIFADAVGALSAWPMHGGIESIVTDAGNGYIHDRFRAAVADIGATQELPPAGMPSMRGRIERFFGSTAIGLVPRFTGRTFSNVVERAEYASEENASLTDDDIGKVFIRYFVDVYHRSPHEGLGGETPFEAWNRGVEKYGTLPPPDANTRRAIFGLHITRTITNRGVRFLGNFYTSKPLQEYFLHNHELEVDVRVDPEDIGRISVKLVDEWVTVPCRGSDFGGVAIETWIKAASDLRRRYQHEAQLARPIVRAALQAIDDIAATAKMRANIGPDTMSTEKVERAERDLFIGFEVGDDDSASTSEAVEADVFADMIPVRANSTREPASEPEATSTGWVIKD